LAPVVWDAPQDTSGTRHNLADFLLLWSGQVISTVGTQMSGLALPLLVLALTHSAVQAGLIAAVSLEGARRQRYIAGIDEWLASEPGL
jgi:hypothetical protein